VISALIQRCGSQRAAAEAVGVSLRQPIRWLTGDSVPRERNRRQIEAACDRPGIRASDLPGVKRSLRRGTGAAHGPAITSVVFSRVGRARYQPHTYAVTIRGTGFGAPPQPTPFVGLTDRFRIANNAQLGFGEYGYTGEHKKLSYQRWSDTEIVVRGFKARPGDSAVVALWDERGHGAAWGANVTPIPERTPRIEKVTFRGGGKNLRITITGSGFGDAPRRMPYRGNLDYFSFTNSGAAPKPVRHCSAPALLVSTDIPLTGHSCATGRGATRKSKSADSPASRFRAMQ
jgi:hypothetical protein